MRIRLTIIRTGVFLCVMRIKDHYIKNLLNNNASLEMKKLKSIFGLELSEVYYSYMISLPGRIFRLSGST